ncbi:MAG: hydroxymethylbilane synthase [Thermoplasmata archaeon]
MMATFRVGTRGSPLALAQTEEVLTRLRAAHPDLRFETVPIKTHGDEGYREDLGTSLDGKRAFTKRIEEALLGNRIDFAVHSLKDLPTEMVSGLTIAAIPPRADPRDVLVVIDGLLSQQMPADARVGTSSLRRRAQLLALWPKIRVTELHGNVGTRLRRLDAKEFDAVVVAAAGLARLQLQDRIAEPFSPDVMTPAPGQGALAVEARSKDLEVHQVLSAVDDADARRTTQAERELAARVGGDCNVPFGALASLDRDRLTLRAVVASPDGRRIVRAHAEDSASGWRRVVDAAWKEIQAGGGQEILEELK